MRLKTAARRQWGKRQAWRLCIELLEDRTPLSTITVVNTGDAGPGSLRAAIDQSNLNSGSDTIVFNIPGPGPHKISPLTPIPSLLDQTGGTTIDGRTQTLFGGDGNPLGPEIILDGGIRPFPGLVIRSGGNRVFGVNVRNFADSGIMIENGPDNWVAGNYVGTDETGASLMANGPAGIVIFSSSSNTIGTNGDGDNDAAERNVISGNRFDEVLIHGVDATQNVVAGNRIGTDAAGRSSLENAGVGVAIRDGAHGNTIGTNGDGIADASEGNLISSNGGEGVAIVGANDNVVAGNLIGTDVTGTLSLANGSHGVGIFEGSQRNRIGTDGNGLADADERNVISGNLDSGVFIADPQSDLNVVAGNYIGTDVTGTAALGNGSFGVGLWHSARLNRIGTDGNGPADVAERNVISGNAFDGVVITFNAAESVVAGNFIGTDATGTAALPNGTAVGEPEHRGGLEIANGARDNRIGTNADGVSDELERNIISGNRGNGITVFDDVISPGTVRNVIAGNYIGTDVLGVAALGNGRHGVDIFAAETMIGTNGDGVADAVESNTIAFNSRAGVLVDGEASAGNSIRYNSIHSNGELGIDLGVSGVTENDPGDGDSGPNDLQNFPVLTSIGAAASTRVVGTLNSVPARVFTIDVYRNSAADPPGEGEGDQLLGSFTVNTDGSGDVSFDVTLSAPSAPGDVVTATATDQMGNTSEFSRTVVATVPDSFLATSAVPTSTGFVVQFNRELDRSTLNLGDTQEGALGPSDVVVTGATTGQVNGSLVVDSSGQSITFLATGARLAADTYTVTLRSADNGFKDTAGNLLDGDTNGIAGGDFSGSFAIAPTGIGTVILGIGDFVRGPGQVVNLPADTTDGIPISISIGFGGPVRNAEFRLRFDPALLDVAAVEGGVALPAGATVTANSVSPGVLAVSVTSPVNLPFGVTDLVHLIANVPQAHAGENYTHAHVLDIDDIIVGDGANIQYPVVDDDGLHVAAFFADVSGNGGINASDASQVARVAASLDSGFAQFLLTDPMIIADISGNGVINATDASMVARHAVELPVDEIPPIPGGVVIAGGAGTAPIPDSLPATSVSPSLMIGDMSREPSATTSSTAEYAVPEVIPYAALDAVRADREYSALGNDEDELRLVPPLEEAVERLLTALLAQTA